MSRTRSHTWIDQRSLAMARAIVDKLQREPALFDVAAQNIDRWRAHLNPWPPALREWETIMVEGRQRAIQCLVDDSPRGRRLRQSHPFVGVLTPTERNEIFQRYESISV